MSYLWSVAAYAIILPHVLSQQPDAGNYPEVHLALAIQKCTLDVGCVTEVTGATLDASHRVPYDPITLQSCINGWDGWNLDVCQTPTQCASTCHLSGADYQGDYGMLTTSYVHAPNHHPDLLQMKLVVNGPTWDRVGARVFLTSTDTTQYKIFHLLNSELSFDVDLSQAPCGVDASLYLVQMDADGGMAKYPGNAAGAKFGTGYCDASCPKNTRWINGEANLWSSGETAGDYGSCCTQVDLWEANSAATTMIAKPCIIDSQYRCSGSECSSWDDIGWNGAVCDAVGCDFNSYRLGNPSFYGPAGAIDTSAPFTVVTQFVTDDGTSSGTLTQIRRKYIQNGVTVANANTVVLDNAPEYDSITDDFCNMEKATFDESNTFAMLGGLSGLGRGLDQGMVLVMSISDDADRQLEWLDGEYHGVARGPCLAGEGDPVYVEGQSPGPQVKFSNIRYGEIGSTQLSTVDPGSPTKTATTSTTSYGATATQWGQCGGNGWGGPTACNSPYTCTHVNAFYSYCT